MKISVIMPYYNSEPWIQRCIESMKSNKGSFEFLLVDDRSTDKSRAIAEETASGDDRFTLLANEHTKGVSGARNTGLDHATGKFVTFVDSDDAMAPLAYKVYEISLKSNPDANIIQYNHIRHYRSGREKVKYTNPGGVYSMADKLPLLWEYVTNKLYRRDFIGDIRFRENMQWGEDELFNIECIAKNDCQLICEEGLNFIHYFDNLKSLAKTKTKEMLLDQAHVLEEYMLKHEDPVVRRFVCYWLGVHWQSCTYLDIIGGRTECNT